MKKKSFTFFPLLITFLVLCVVLCGSWGVIELHHTSGTPFKDSLQMIFGTIFYIWQFITLNNGQPEFINWPILIAKLAAAFLISFGVFFLVIDKLKYFFDLFTINVLFRIFKRKYIIICGLGETGYRLGTDCLMNDSKDRKVVFIEENKSNSFISDIRHNGGIVIIQDALDRNVLRKAGLNRAGQVIISTGSDSKNIEIAGIISQLYEGVKRDTPLRVKLGLNERQNNLLFKDAFEFYYDKGSLSIDSFNLNTLIAKTLFDTFPFYYQKECDLQKGNQFSIGIIGYNPATELFILENAILSQTPGPHLQVNVIAEHSASIQEQLRFKYPFLKQFIDLFYFELPDQELREVNGDLKKIYEGTDLFYLFGEDDSTLINQAISLRQVLYNFKGSLYEPAIVCCLPEKNDILKIFKPGDKEITGGTKSLNYFELCENKLNIIFIKSFEDVCKVTKLIDENDIIDQQAKIIHYYYFLRYEIATEIMKSKVEQTSADKNEEFKHGIQKLFWDISKSSNNTGTLLLKEINDKVTEMTMNSFTSINLREFQKHYSLEAIWEALSDLKKESNRYAARHFKVKMTSITPGVLNSNDEGEMENEATMLAEHEHKRWWAEKLVFNFRYGKIERENKTILKEYLKIHDCMLPFNDLKNDVKIKDTDVFMLIRLLEKIAHG